MVFVFKLFLCVFGLFGILLERFFLLVVVHLFQNVFRYCAFFGVVIFFLGLWLFLG